MRMTAKMQNVSTVISQMYDYVKGSKRKYQELSFAYGQRIYDLSQYYVPVDTGALKNSGRLEATGDGFDQVVRVSYNTEYAIYVHEILTNFHEPPTSAKYLQRAIDEVYNMYKSRPMRLSLLELERTGAGVAMQMTGPFEREAGGG